MPSPFLGMDPYLENPNIWEDFHTSLAAEIRDQLTQHIRPRYIAALVPNGTYDEVTIEERRLAKPDVSVFEVASTPLQGEAVAIAPAPLIGQAPLEIPLKLHSVELREVETGRLVTAIEILSPVNKRPGHEAYETYRRKRRDLIRAGVHLLELDLLRGGQRLPLLTRLPESPYFVFLTREGRTRVEIWPVSWQEAIPILPVPLLEPDPDAPLDLGQAIHRIYDRAAYDLRLDYRQAPPKPALTPEDAARLEAHLKAAQVR
jgi:hypothetical protein